MSTNKCYVVYRGTETVTVYLVPDLRPTFTFEIRNTSGLAHPVAIVNSEEDVCLAAESAKQRSVVELGSISNRFVQLLGHLKSAHPDKYPMNSRLAEYHHPKGSPSEWEGFLSTGRELYSTDMLELATDPDVTLESVDALLRRKIGDVDDLEWRRLAPFLACAACVPNDSNQPRPKWWIMLASRVEAGYSCALTFAQRDLCVAASRSPRPPRVVADTLWFAYFADTVKFTSNRTMQTRTDPIRLAFCRMADNASDLTPLTPPPPRT